MVFAQCAAKAIRLTTSDPQSGSAHAAQALWGIHLSGEGHPLNLPLEIRSGQAATGQTCSSGANQAANKQTF